MSRFNTGNPLGSGSPLDLDDNAKNLDQAVNTEQDTFQDRLGKSRLTWSGMENQFESDQSEREVQFDADQADRDHRFDDFIESSGYQFVGDYAAGIELTEYNQLIRDSGGEFWRASGQIDLPYTTTGNGVPEGDALVSVGDAVLRQDLASPDKGAAMVARGVVAVDSIADLLALPEGQRKEGLRYLVKGYHSGSDIGGGEFRFSPHIDGGAHDGGKIISPEAPFPSDWGDQVEVEEWYSGGGGVGAFISIGDSKKCTPFEYGALDEDAFDSAKVIEHIIGKVSPTLIDLRGGGLSIMTDVQTSFSNVTILDGSIRLVRAYLNLWGSGIRLRGLEVSGAETLGWRAMFTGVYLGNHTIPPSSANNGDAYVNSTDGETYILFGGVWVARREPAGLRFGATGGKVATTVDISECRFRDLRLGVGMEADGDAQQATIISDNSFINCASGVGFRNPKRQTVTSNRFISCGYGLSTTSDNYAGLGLILTSNYFNACWRGASIRDSIYDSVISSNIFDHNSWAGLGDNFTGDTTGLHIHVGSGRVSRALSITGNSFRNNGPSNAIFHIEGQLDYSNISHNVAHIAGETDFDFIGSGKVDNTQYLDNKLNNGTRVSPELTTISFVRFSPYSGGQIRGRVHLDVGVVLEPRANTWVNIQGFMQYSDSRNGPTVVAERMSGDLAQLDFQLVDWATSATFASRAKTYQVGACVYNTTLNKPLWYGTGGVWRDAMGTAVTF